jgi:hypothetical protein
MAGRLDWEAATKRDYVRDHGFEPSWVDAPPPRPKSKEDAPPKRRPTKAATAAAARIASATRPTISAFAAQPTVSQERYADHYRRRIREICDRERARLPGTPRVQEAVSAAEADALAELGRIAKRTKRDAKAGQRQTASVARRPLGRGERRDAPDIRLSATLKDGSLTAKWASALRPDSWTIVVLAEGRRLAQRVSLDAARHSWTSKPLQPATHFSVRLQAIQDDKRLARAVVDVPDSRASKAASRTPASQGDRPRQSRPPSKSKKRRLPQPTAKATGRKRKKPKTAGVSASKRNTTTYPRGVRLVF